MKDVKDADTRDAAMIGAGQAAEHYEITRYGTLISWANASRSQGRRRNFR